MITMLTAAFAGPVTYAVEPTSWLAVMVSYDRSALGGGHDHVVVPNTVSGKITWDPDNPSLCSVFLEFPATALQIDPPGARARFKLEGDTSAGDQKSIKSNMQGKHQLQADKFSSITYRSTSCRGTGKQVEVTGGLSIHGVRLPVTTIMTVQAHDGMFHATGAFSATHSDFGLSPFSALLGALRNDEKLSFKIDVRAKAP